MPTGKPAMQGGRPRSTIRSPMSGTSSPRSNGLPIWLGDGVRLKGSSGETYETADGTTGGIRTFHRQDRIRLTWQPDNWGHETIVQIALRANGDRTKLPLHQERLASKVERERQRDHWKAIAATLADRLDQRRAR
jgi:uncharacterized protein YndB with AHSA1/START domain